MEVTKIAVHSGKFHADDVCAVATLLLYLGIADPESMAVEIIRTRDKEQIGEADYVFDVGMEYDPNRHRYDHHQDGGAGVRENGISFAAFGLAWKHFGGEVCGSQEVADKIERRMVMPLDASDNGEEYFDMREHGLLPYGASIIVGAFLPTWQEQQTEETLKATFIELVRYAMIIIRREVAHAQASVEGHKHVEEAYQRAEDKRVIVLDVKLPWEERIEQYPEPVFVAYPQDDMWRARAVRSGEGLFKNRKDFPKAWAGLDSEELPKVTGVEDALFCHRKLFTVAAKSKEGILELVKQALNA